MAVYMLIFAAALVLAIGSTPLAKRVALTTGTVDAPTARKLHQRTVPLLGGVAIYVGVVAALLVFGDRFYVGQLAGILIGATMVSFLGIWDDKKGLRPILKLLGQIVAACVLVASGVYVEVLREPWLNYVITVFWVVAITNSINLLDNMDGLSGGVAAVAASFFFLLAAFSGQYFVGSLAIAVAGACIGFLYYNFNPASIFMGDAGSMFLGYLLAALGIKLRFDNLDIVTWMVPVLVLGVPIFDTALVIISRLRRGLNPLTTPGKDHTSHRLVAMGLTHREAVMVLYLACGALGMCALFITRATVVEGYVLGGLIIVAAVYCLIRLEKVPYQGNRRSS